MKKIGTAKFWLCIALILCLLSMIGASAVQTASGKIDIETLTWIGEAGNKVSATLYVPENAAADSPAPGIVTVHGWWNNRGMQDLYSLELAKRGYVVLSPDMYGHGDSQFTTWEDLYVDGCGEYTAVQLLANLPYVDSGKIGITGHSSGGDMIGQAVAIDNEQETQLISACLFQASYLSDDAGVNHQADFGSRDLGILASQYDEFFYITTENTDVYIQKGLPGAADGSEIQTNPAREFINSSEAKNFLNFNEGAEGFDGTPVAGQYYSRQIDGSESVRVIYTPEMTHPKVVFSKECVADAIEFFDRALGAPNPIPANSQTWELKTAFNLIGLIGFFMIAVTFPLTMLETSMFSELRAKTAVGPLSAPKGKEKAWFWSSLSISAVFSALTYYWIIGTMTDKQTKVGFFPQTSSLAIGLWATLCGMFTLVLLFVYCKTFAKGSGFSLRERGVLINGRRLWKTIELAVLTVCVTMGVLWFADYFFKTDFRYYVLTYRVFNSQTAGVIIRFVPFFLVFYVINSVATNSFNYVKTGNKAWINMFIIALFNALGVIVYNIIQYGVQRATGSLAFGGTLGQCISGIWVYPTAFFLFVTPIMSRAIYKKTNNPYLGGIINAFLVTIFLVAQSVTILPS